MLKLKGDIDASSSIRLDIEIEAAITGAYSKILVDCTSLDYISSAGLGVFMSYIHELEEKKMVLVLFGINKKVLEIYPEILNSRPEYITELKSLLIDNVLKFGEDINNLAWRAYKKP